MTHQYESPNRDRAAQLLIHYFSQTVEMPSDAATELRSLVDAIVDAAVEEMRYELQAGHEGIEHRGGEPSADAANERRTSEAWNRLLG